MTRRSRGDRRSILAAALLGAALAVSGCTTEEIAGSIVGANVIVNTRASLDHECWIGDHVHLAPGVVLSGMVTVEEGAHIGTGAILIQGVRVGARALVPAGAIVLGNVPAGGRADRAGRETLGR